MKKQVLPILLLLDGIALGGLVALFLIGNMILDKASSAGEMNQAVYNLLDHIFPYKIFLAAMLCVVAILTIVVWFIGKSRRTATDLGAK